MTLSPLSLSSAPAAEPLELNLWEGNPPNMVPGATGGHDNGTGRIVDVGIPGMVVHFPNSKTTNRPALLVCPGGGYHHLAGFAVGNGTVKRFLPRDFVVVVLKYRTNPPCKDVGPDALADAKRAMRLIRLHAKEWGIDPHRVAMAGWSAGGNLTLNLTTHWDLGNPSATEPVEQQSCRPDVVAMMCPWPWNKQIADYPVSKDCPPAFIASAKDDTTAPTSFAQSIADGYEKAGVRSKLWIIETGGHGAFSLASKGEGAQWDEQFMKWLEWPKP